MNTKPKLSEISIASLGFINKYKQLAQSGKITTAAPLLPLLFNIRGKPMTLDNHPPFEEFFKVNIPTRTTFKTARQVGKSTVLSIKSLLLTITQPYFTLLHVTPLFEQIRRFSTNYISPRIYESPIRDFLVSTKTKDSVLHKTFLNKSQLLFSYCYLNCDRVLGISAQGLACDEVQDLDSDHIPIIREVTSYFPEWGIEFFTGTPRTWDNTIHTLWEDSSQAEWFIPCQHCTTNGYPTWNIPSIEHHLNDIIGPWHPYISEEYPGTICHKCKQPISPRLGRWVHRFSEKIKSHSGFHIPQLIMPFHYAYPHKWLELLEKRRGMHNTTTASFYNEVLGESYDESTKLVSEYDMLQVSNLGPCTTEIALEKTKEYRMTALGADWGGGGQQGVSYTALALVGLTNDNKLEVPWAIRLYTPHDHLREAGDVMSLWKYFRPDVLAHDYNGAGSLRETLLVQGGLPLSHIMPIAYIRSPVGAVCRRIEETATHPREHYLADKTRTLLLLCALIRLGGLRFFDYDGKQGKDSLLTDFLALTEDKVRFGGGHELYRVSRAKNKSDDIAMAVNLACIAIWQHTQWPKLIKTVGGKLNKQQMAELDPQEW